MDKYEYKVRAEQIKALIREGEYVQAAEIADTIDWRRIRNVAMLCTISDLYKINRRYEDARDMLLLAYDRHPGGRSICYSLCELSIKLEEFPQAVEYYKEFVQVAPRDNGRYILQYKLYEAQNVNLEERIAVLEEYKKRGEYREKWLYELAFLYHRVGLGTRCVEICDELILLFGNGKYVIKAMELKMLHEPLTPAQQAKYDNRFQGEEGADISQGAEEPQGQEETDSQEDGTDASDGEPAQIGEEVYQAASGEENVYGEAADTESVYGEEPYEEGPYEEGLYEEGLYEEGSYEKEPYEENRDGNDQEAPDGNIEGSGNGEDQEDSLEKNMLDPAAPTQIYDVSHVQEVEKTLAEGQPEDAEELEIQVKTVDVSEYNTINLQKELAEGLREVLQEEMGNQAGSAEAAEDIPEQMEEIAEGGQAQMDEEIVVEDEGSVEYDETAEGEEYWPEEVLEEEPSEEPESWPEEEENGWTEEVVQDEPLPEELAEVLSMSSDGQIHMVVPDDVVVEDTQIEGQITFDEVLNGNTVNGDTVNDDTENDGAENDGTEDGDAEEAPLPVEEEFEELVEIEDSEDAGEIDAEPEEDLEETSAEEPEENLEEISAEEPEEDLEESTAEESEEDLTEPEALDEKEEGTAAENADESDAEEAEDDSRAGDGSKGAGEEKGSAPLERDKARVRELTQEERDLFGQFLQNRADRERLVKALDSISMAAYTGNVIVTGDEGLDTFSFAKNIVMYVQLSDTNFSGKTAKISGAALNAESVEKVLGQLENGALIIQKASAMNEKTCSDLYKILQRESLGIIVILEDTKRAMNRFLAKNKALAECFNARVDMEALSDETLVAFGKKYAKELEYSIDEMGVLALHTRIHDMQSSDHAVTVMEVKEIVDEAIKRANRKNLKHFFDILFGKRYDEEDMIILREKDFLA